MCEERYNDELYEIISNPNYDRTLLQVHKFIDKEKQNLLLKYDQIALDQGNFELLIGLDTCSYRTPCKTVLGDRSFSITQKRYQAKMKLLELYKEQVQQDKIKPIAQKSNASSQSNIFDLDNDSSKDKAVNKLREAVKT